MSVIICPAWALSDQSCKDPATVTAQNFVLQDSTFKFDGLKDTLSIEQAGPSGRIAGSGMMLTMAVPLENGQYKILAKFDSRHSGYGDRTGKILAQVITPHTAEITVAGCQVTSAVMDGKWNMLTDKPVE